MTFAAPADRRDDAARSLDERIAAHILGPPDDAAFERLALEVFAYQYERNAPYRALCEHRGVRPADVSTWRHVPPVSAASFAEARIACFPPERCAVAFESSGTTTRGRASRHELDAASLYAASLREHYRAMVMPETGALRHVFLAPPFEEAPASSLSFMMSELASKFGTSESEFYVRNGRLDFSGVADALRSREPCVVFGTAFAFVHFFDHCRAAGLRFELPAQSRVVETGGFKGKSREVARDELYDWFERLLGVPRAMCVSEYGMCELGSQWYDANLSDFLAGREPRAHVKIGPHWTRTTVVDPVSALELPHGSHGLLQVFDLSNRGSAAAILTGDVARDRDGGIEILGRHPGAPPKGCSIAADDILSAADR